MPVEESGNMLILIDALARVEKNNAGMRSLRRTVLALQLTKLGTSICKEKGLDPENQLSTG